MLTFGGWNAILTKSVGDTDKKPTDKTLMWGLSSAGRASALQAEGHRFEPYRPHFYTQKFVSSLCICIEAFFISLFSPRTALTNNKRIAMME